LTKYAEIVGWGKYLPSRVVTNDDIAKNVDTSDEWIVSHTGIRERRVAGPGETSVSMSVAAARDALTIAELKPTDLDLIIVSTYTPDYHLPGAAPMVQKELGATRAAAFDLRAGCPGFVYGLSIGSQFIASGTYQRVLVIAAELVSQFINWRDRRTCALFGDGAGAVVLEASERRTGVLSFAMGTQGADYDALMFRAAGSRHPITDQPFDEDLRSLQMDGRRILNFAMRTVAPTVYKELAKNAMSKDDIALVIPQQSNLRFIEWISNKLGFPMEKVFVNVDRYANTSSASVAIALCEAFEQGRVQDGDHILLLSFGAGLNWASAVVRCGVAEEQPAIMIESSWQYLAVERLLKRARAMAESGIMGITSAVTMALPPFLSRRLKK
jgi:3-oxoacyl-[acyl-carrier-protein] synthase-3